MNEKINEDAVFEILVDIAHKKKINYSNYEILTEEELSNKVKDMVTKYKNLPLNAVIGKVMGKLRGKAKGRIVVELVKKYYK